MSLLESTKSFLVLLAANNSKVYQHFFRDIPKHFRAPWLKIAHHYHQILVYDSLSCFEQRLHSLHVRQTENVRSIE